MSQRRWRSLPRKIGFFWLRHWRHNLPLQGHTRLWLYPARGTETSHISPLSYEGTIPSGKEPWKWTLSTDRRPVVRSGDVGRFRGLAWIEKQLEMLVPHSSRSLKPVQELEEVHERLVQWHETSFVGGKKLKYKLAYICSNLSKRS